MSSTLFVEAFGQLSQDANLPGMILEEEEDLHSVFRERGELMRWSTTQDRSSLLWDMEEAELTAGDGTSRIGWVQVGLNVGPVEPIKVTQPQAPIVQGRRYEAFGAQQRAGYPVEVLPALIQCFDDSLRRFGDVEVSSFQVTASRMEHCIGDSIWYLVSVLNWFNLDGKAGADAIVALDQGLLKNHAVAKLVTGLQQRNNGTFEFRSVVDVPDECMVKVTTSDFLHPVTPQSPHGVLVSLPEWTPSATGWVLASVINAARAIESDTKSFMIRITRV